MSCGVRPRTSRKSEDSGARGACKSAELPTSDAWYARCCIVRTTTTQSTRFLAASLLAFTAAAPGCGSDGGGSVHPISFDDLAVGQRSRYAVLVGEDYASPTESPYRYVDGVLVAEVVGHDDLGFRVREWFDVPVDVTQAAELEELEPGAVYEYRLRVNGDALEVLLAVDHPRSRLFQSWTNRALPLDDIEGQQTAIFGWRAALPYCECYEEAFVVDGQIRGATYGRLNVVVDNEAMQVDGPGATKLYSARHGLVRSTRYSWWTGGGVGLDLIPGD